MVDEQAHAGVEMPLTNTGNLTISGTLTQNSDRTTKTDIFERRGRTRSWPRWTACRSRPGTDKGDAATVQHLGPMAQDFSAAFGLGADDRHIAPLDAAGVSLAAIQALTDKVTEKEVAIDDLSAAQRRSQKRLADLETLVAKLAPAVQK